MWNRIKQSNKILTIFKKNMKLLSKYQKICNKNKIQKIVKKKY